MNNIRIHLILFSLFMALTAGIYSSPIFANASSGQPRKVALVTGASRGIGFALTKQLLEEGIKVIAIARNVETLSSLKQQFPEQLQVISADLSTKEGQRSLAPAVLTTKLDYLVHNAAIIEPIGKNVLLEASPEDIHKIMEVNVMAPMILTNQLAPKLGQGSRILIVSSRAGDKMLPGMGLYCLSKTALDRYTESLQQDLPRGILAACVHPGDVNTDMQADLRKQNTTDLPLTNFFRERQDKLTSPDISGRYLTWLLLKTSDKDFMSKKHNIYDSSHHTHWSKGAAINDPFPGHDIK
jgi:NAD(P)-dependent dehydrogenase (short-subunit alcohol dehydrogenase family)